MVAFLLASNNPIILDNEWNKCCAILLSDNKAFAFEGVWHCVWGVLYNTHVQFHQFSVLHAKCIDQCLIQIILWLIVVLASATSGIKKTQGSV